MTPHDDANAGSMVPATTTSPWRVIGWVCAGVIVTSVISCIVMAAVRSVGLTQITVTALDGESEPRDHKIPFVKQKESLPDYELKLVLSGGQTLRLGAKVNVSAVDGLTWHLPDPVSVAEIATVHLQEQDKIVSDAIAEVELTGDTVVDRGYRFDFATERSFSIGVESFFATPIGKSIAAGFFIAVLMMLASIFCT